MTGRTAPTSAMSITASSPWAVACQPARQLHTPRGGCVVPPSGYHLPQLHILPPIAKPTKPGVPRLSTWLTPTLSDKLHDGFPLLLSAIVATARDRGWWPMVPATRISFEGALTCELKIRHASTSVAPKRRKVAESRRRTPNMPTGYRPEPDCIPRTRGGALRARLIIFLEHF